MKILRLQSTVPKDAPVVLKVEHLNAGKMVQDVSFELRKGEILGFSGLDGCWTYRDSKSYYLELTRSTVVTFTLMVKKLHIKSPEDAVRCGIGYLSEDRKRYGIVVQKSVAENTINGNNGTVYEWYLYR